VSPRAVAAAVLWTLLAAAACTSGGSGGPLHTGAGPTDATGPTGETAPAGGPLTLRVMEFNVEYGGRGVDFDSVPEVIEASAADIVAIEEGYGNMANIAASVGWEHVDPRTQVLSRFPLLLPPGDLPFVYVEVEPGRVVAVANVHLPSTSYGPFLVRDGARLDEVLAIEEHKRVAALAPTLDVVEDLAAQGVPTFLIGDFNAPSHLDWTEAAVGAREHVRFPVAWPASLAVEAAGFVDSYRAANPDPVADPGLTWPAGRPIVPGYNPFRRGAPADRIDFVYGGGPLEVVDSLLVGESGGEGVDVAVDPWPTDHRATVSTFEVEPASAPTLVSPDTRLVAVGEQVVVRFHAEDGADALALVPEGAAANAADQTVEFHEGTRSGDARFVTENLSPGAYDAVLVSRSRGELARATVWVQAAGGAPEVHTVRSTFDVGEPFEVEWRFAPGNRWDWVGVYRRGENPGRYLLWVHTRGTVEGSAVFDRDSVGAWPLSPGEYSVYLLRDDSYRVLARGDFTVRAA
jgi:hypothetical protein